MPFLALFIFLPLLELIVFIMVGDEIGYLTAFLITIVTAIVGGALVKAQGLQTLFELRRQLDGGQLPVMELFTGVCLVAAGAMLITPGFVTDTLGFLLLVPGVRAKLYNWVRGHIRIFGGDAHTSNAPQNDDIIDADFKDVTDEDDKRIP